jgi:acyl-CoA thioesterase-2
VETISASIVDVLDLERIEEDIFRGQSQDIGTGRVFGGQVLGQALRAAQFTVGELAAHSVHAYFLRKGDFDAPIIYNVDRSRDGRSFSSRRVVAIQHGRPIFTLSASFQRPEEGLEFQLDFDVPDLDSAPPASSIVAEGKGFESLPGFPGDEAAEIQPTDYFEIRRGHSSNGEGQPYLEAWLRARGRLPDDVDVHRAVLAYLSDFTLLAAALVPHGYRIGSRLKDDPGIIAASIDHVLWFHRPFRADEWLLYHCSPVSTSGARGLARGSLYTADGQLVATTMQEGLIREIDARR